MTTTIYGRIEQIGDGEDGMPRIIIATTEEQLKAITENILFKTATINIP